MGTKKTTNFSRRSFIKMSALTSGGIVFGLNSLNAASLQILDSENANPNDCVEFNAFVKIDTNGKVLIFSPNPEIGQGVKTSMPMLVAEELDVAWKNVEVVQAGLDTKKYKRQVAGGSQSIRFSWIPLREAGAKVRKMFVQAAASKWKVSIDSCRTKEGVVYHDSGEKAPYETLLKEAAQQPIPNSVTLKNTADFTIIGQNAFNVDLDAIVSGKPLYGLDFKRDGMEYASVIRPPSFGQKLLTFDKSKALKIGGVTEVVRFGNNIAVLGKNTWSIFQGKKEIQATYTSNENIPGSVELEADLEERLNSDDLKIVRSDGDIAASFANADKIIERDYHIPFMPHNCLEPMNFFAHVTDEKVELVGPIQTPALTARKIAKLLKRDIDEVSVELTRMGGGFGRRLFNDFVVDAAIISNKTKKPIKLVYSREDDMSAGRYKPLAKYKIAAAVKDSKITGYQLKEAAVNATINPQRASYFPAGSIENYQINTFKLKNKITTGAWRAPICNFLAFADQVFFDELAVELQQDPIDMRLNLLKVALKNKDARIEFSPERMIEVVKKARQVSNWGKNPKGTYQGFSAYYSHNSYVAEIAEVVLEGEIPKVKKVYCVVDCGIVVNPTGAINQVAGGVIDGMGHAMFGELLFEKGKPLSSNFYDYRLIRMAETPKVEVVFIESNEAPTGLGEPTLPPASAAVANAIQRATGKRIRKIPFINEIEL